MFPTIFYSTNLAFLIFIYNNLDFLKMQEKENLFLLTTEKRQSKFIKEIDEDLYLENIINTSIVEDKENEFKEIYNGIISPENLSLSAS